ncbi:hypothetical protein WKI68_00340 [Streptomyces sp. MS1.HAVA.3]|uniref:HTH tetR-type domain-containing protein n=1 Tax=Streptomyces caledonius TaxID=3134107 RepID=A0ABU8TZ46_9ACTN
MARARQERAEITRQAILDGAAIAFDQCGFGGTSLSDIVKHAGSPRAPSTSTSRPRKPSPAP